MVQSTRDNLPRDGAQRAGLGLALRQHHAAPTGAVLSSRLLVTTAACEPATALLHLPYALANAAVVASLPRHGAPPQRPHELAIRCASAPTMPT